MFDRNIFQYPLIKTIYRNFEKTFNLHCDANKEIFSIEVSYISLCFKSSSIELQ